MSQVVADRTVTDAAGADEPSRRPVPLGRFTRPYLLLAPLAVLYLVAFLLPFVLIVTSAFSSPDHASLTGSNFADFFTAPGATATIIRTLKISLITTGVSLVIGYPTAAALLRLRGGVRGVALILILSPLLMSLLARTFGWWTILGPGPVGNFLGRLTGTRNLLFSQTAIVIALVSIYIPFMVLSIMASLQAIDRDTRRAARGLGAGPFTVLRTIDLPLSVPGVLGGVLIVFCLSLGNYATASILGGFRNGVVAMRAVTALQSEFNRPLSSAISVLLVVVALAANALNLAIIRRYSARRAAGVFD